MSFVICCDFFSDTLASQCKLYWQNQGDFLCVKVDRHTKTFIKYSDLSIFDQIVSVAPISRKHCFRALCRAALPNAEFKTCIIQNDRRRGVSSEFSAHGIRLRKYYIESYALLYKYSASSLNYVFVPIDCNIAFSSTPSKIIFRAFGTVLSNSRGITSCSTWTFRC